MLDVELINQLNIYKREILAKLIDGVDDEEIRIKEISGQLYVSYSDVVKLITDTKPEIKE